MARTQRYAVIVGYAHNDKPYTGHVLDVIEASPRAAALLRERFDNEPDPSGRGRLRYLVDCGDQDVIVGDEVDVDERGYVRGP